MCIKDLHSFSGSVYLYVLIASESEITSADGVCVPVLSATAVSPDSHFSSPGPVSAITL